MSKTILTVDDSRVMREMLRHALVEHGFNVVQAEDGDGEREDDGGSSEGGPERSPAAADRHPDEQDDELGFDEGQESGEGSGGALAVGCPEVEQEREAEGEEGLRVAEGVALEERIAAEDGEDDGEDGRPGERGGAGAEEAEGEGDGDSGHSDDGQP